MNQLAVIGQAKALLNSEDLEILKKSKFKNFTDEEIAFCAKVSSQLQLSPFLNQIHFVKRKNKDGSATIATQVGIDGFRLAAMRAGGYAGSDEPIFEYAPNDQVKKRPIKATVSVYRIVEGMRCPFTASARWDEYYASVGGMWEKMPHQMLSKCAEALALRKAFPAELAGVKTDEEMQQADGPSKAETVQKQVLGEAIEDAEIVEEPAPAQGPNCEKCGSKDLMISKYDENVHFCKSCKHKQPRF